MYQKGKLKSEWITDSQSWSESNPIEWAKNFGKFLAKKGNMHGNVKLCDFDCNQGALTTSQLRRFFGQLKRIQVEGFSKSAIKLQMLVPQLAYAVGRDLDSNKKNKTKINFFYEELSNAIKHVKSESDFKNFVNLVEAIVAYHKVEGGE